MTQHDAAADLAYIRQVMEQTQRYTATSGKFFIAWGVVICLGLFGSWLQIVRGLGGSNLMLWMACILAGWIATAWLVRRERLAARAMPVNARYIGLNWAAVGGAMTLVFFVGVPAETVPYKSIAGLSAAIVGIGVFNTAVLAGLRWLIYIGIGWWLGAGVMLAYPGLHTLWVMALMLLFLQIVPGIVLERQVRARD